jgi:tetratricopeptide (TPR) repeat protein
VLRFAAARPAISRAWKLAYGAGCLLALLLFLFYLLPHYATAANYAGRSYDAWQRELTQLRALSMYIGWSVLPLPSQMHFYYDNYTVSTGLLHPITTLFGGLFLLGLLSLALAVRHRRPLLALGIGWFFMAHALTSSPLPLELVFEHRNYPALFGILLAAADLIWLACRHAHPRLPALLATVFILNLGFMTVLRASTWGNQLQLAMTLTQDNPGSPRAALDLARRCMARAQGDPSAPLFSLSVKELERAAALPGASILAEEALILTAADQHAPSPEIWWNSLLHKLSSQPLGVETYQALFKLDQQLVIYKKNIDARQLARAYAIAIRRNPTRMSLYVQYAEIASVALHDPDLAIEQWQHALSLDKNPAGYAKQLITYLLDNQRYQEAAAVMAKALQLQPALRRDTEFQSRQALLEQATSPRKSGTLEPTGKTGE